MIRRPWIVLVFWVATAVTGVALIGTVFSALHDSGKPGRTEASRTADLVRARSPVGEQLVVLVASTSSESVREAQIVAAALVLTPGIARVSTATSPGADRLVADDGRSQLLVVDLAPRLSAARVHRAVSAVQRIAHQGITTAEVKVGGQALVGIEAARGARADLVRGEAIALPIALIFLIIVFGGFTAAGAPVLAALSSVGGALLVLWPIAHLRDVSPYAINVMTMFGLALGIDYGLLVVSRFREERHRGLDLEAAVLRTGQTAGRIVTFSGLTVIGALSGLLLFDDPMLTSLALGGGCVVALSVIAARTLIPAYLRLFGHRIAPRAPASDTGRLARLASAVVRRPWPVALVVTGGLVLTALPVLHAAVVLPDQRVLPASSQTRQVADVLAADYVGRYDPSVTVVGKAPAVEPAWRSYLASLPGVTSVTLRSGFGTGLHVLDVHVRGTGQDAAAQELVRAIRADGRTRSFPVQVTGQAATLVDYRHQVAQRLPWAIGVVIATTLLLLFAMTGSVVVPVKAVVMGLLSLTATMGVLVWGFQDGHLTGDAVGGLSAEVPLVVFVFALGLSLDYEAFLLGRVREAWLESGDNDRAVITGLQRSAGVITSAAALVVIVFLGFASGQILVVRELGVGLAVAVVVDATVVRCLLVPAVMALLGGRNWWAPAPVARWHSRVFAAVDLSGHDAH